MTTDSTNSIEGADANPDSTGEFDGDDAAGDAVSGVSDSGDGAPTPTGSIPPGPADPDGGDDDLVNPEQLPPLGERMY